MIPGSYNVEYSQEAAAGSLHNPVAKIKIKLSGKFSPINISKIKISLAGTTNLNDIYSVGIYASPMLDQFFDFSFYRPIDYPVSFNAPPVESKQFGESIKNPLSELTFYGNQECNSYSTCPSNTTTPSRKQQIFFLLSLL
ncbi:MAG: hypothetical protein IPO92_18000 [Saprospiraceae bacterium]|nr:hypothetical protein [Saprospiraceae bacterium]